MRRVPLRPLIVAVLPAVLAGCDARAERTAVVRDSAGIAIVEHGVGEAVQEWQLGEPTVALGALGAGEAYELYQPLHALRLDDGRIVVANHGTQELRFYGPDGTHLRSVGRSGGGPGEYEDMWGLVRLPGDSLGAWDWTANRLTVYDDRGTFARVVTPTADVGQFGPRLLGALDNTFAVLRGFDAMAIFAAGGGVRQDSVRLLRLALRDGGVVDSLGPYPGPEHYVHMGDRAFWIRTTKYGREEHVDVAAGRVVVGDDRTGELRIFAADGALRRIIRPRHEPTPVTDEHLARYDEAFLEDLSGNELAEMRRRLAEIPAADHLPAFGQLFVDRLGRIWIEGFDTDPATPDIWTILDPDGHLLARVRLPPRASPRDAGEDYVVVYDRDELDVERVAVHPLTAMP